MPIVSVTVPIEMDRDLQTIESGMRAILDQDERIAKTPPPDVATSRLTDKLVELSIQAWTDTADAEAVRSDLIRRLVAVVKTTSV